MSKVRGIRGAIRIDANGRESLLAGTKKLLLEMLRTNQVDTSEIASIFFTATDDLNADFPAYAAREIGLNQVPLLCAREINVPGGMTRLVRILIHVNTDKPQNQILHQYLGETSRLRPDIPAGEIDDDSNNEK